MFEGWVATDDEAFVFVRIRILGFLIFLGCSPSGSESGGLKSGSGGGVNDLDSAMGGVGDMGPKMREKGIVGNGRKFTNRAREGERGNGSVGVPGVVFVTFAVHPGPLQVHDALAFIFKIGEATNTSIGWREKAEPVAEAVSFLLRKT